MFTQEFKITGFECPSCLKLAKMDIEDIAGVEELTINDNGQAELVSSREINKAEITEAIQDKKLKVEA